MPIAVRKSEGGYFTIEAAFIGSLTCFFVIAFWLIAIYLFDFGCVDSCLKEQAVILSVGEKEEQQKVQVTKEELEKSLLVASLDSFWVVRKGEQITGKARISVKIPIPIVGEWIGKKWTNSIVITMEQGNNKTKMRRWDQLE